MEESKGEIILQVLIVDDESGMREGAARCLRNFKVEQKNFGDIICFETRTASDGAQAIKAIEEKFPDLLILDYKLPDMTGIEIIESFDNPSFVTIMITAFASLDLAIRATKKGAFDFLAKPFTPEELRVIVKRAAKNIYMTRKAKKLDDEKKRVRFEFISVLAHELKSPIATVEGYLHLMNEKFKGNEISNYDQIIKRSLIRTVGMRKLVMDLLDLTRLESGKKKRTIETVNINSLIEEVVENVSTLAARKKVNLKIKCDPKFSIQADRGEIEIIISNLLTNAVKYNKDGGSALLEVKKTDNNNFSLKCSDTGIGMKKEELKKLFKEFVRIKNEKTRMIEGSGLGLSILKKTVELYDGEIKVESEYDKGTSFNVFLKEVVQKKESINLITSEK
jgi:two-component system, sensor histidine kinase and response regulator